MYTARFTELNGLLAIEHADSQAAGTHASAWVNVRNYHRLALVLSVGEMQAGATFDAQLRQATDTAGTGAKVIADKATTGTKAITQLTQAGGDSDDPIVIELQTEELDVTNGFDCVQFSIVVANAAVEYCAMLFGFEPRYPPVPITNWTEIID
jgi:hypothetical protein